MDRTSLENVEDAWCVMTWVVLMVGELEHCEKVKPFRGK